jgi:antitoxin YefM
MIRSMETTYLNLRRDLAGMLDRVIDDREVIIVCHRGVKTVAILPADEFDRLIETANLLGAPRSAKRPLKALPTVPERTP